MDDNNKNEIIEEAIKEFEIKVLNMIVDYRYEFWIECFEDDKKGNISSIHFVKISGYYFEKEKIIESVKNMLIKIYVNYKDIRIFDHKLIKIEQVPQGIKYEILFNTKFIGHKINERYE